MKYAEKFSIGILLFLIFIWGQDPTQAQKPHFGLEQVAYSKDGNYIALGYNDGTLIIHKTQGLDVGDVVFEAAPERDIRFIRWNPVYESQILYVGTGLFVYDVATPGQHPTAYYIDWTDASAAEWTTDGQHIIATGETNLGDIRPTVLFDASSMEIVEEVDNPSYGYDSSYVAAIKISPDGSSFIVGRSRSEPWQRAYIRSLSNPEHPILYEFDTHDQIITDFAWTSDVLVMQRGQSTLSFYNPTTYKPLNGYIPGDKKDEIPEDIRQFKLRPNTTQIAVSIIGHIYIVDWVTQQKLFDIEKVADSLDWSPDGRYLAYQADGELYIQEPPFPLYMGPTSTSTAPSPSYVEDVCDVFTYAEYSNLIAIISEANASQETTTICLYPDYRDMDVNVPVGFLFDASGKTLLPTIEGDVLIDGTGGTFERTNESALFRFFSVAPEGHLTLRNLTLRGGLLEEGQGAAILNQGQLTLDHIVFTRNCLVDEPCEDSDAIYNDGGEIIATDVFWGNVTLPPPTPTLTLVPTLTPLPLDNPIPVVFPTSTATPTP